MKRRVCILLAGVLAAGTLVFSSQAPPASAVTDKCLGMGTVFLGGPGLYYPAWDTTSPTTGTSTTMGTPPTVTVTAFTSATLARTMPFVFSLTSGVCIVKPGLSASGLVSGFCGHSWATAITSNGYRFNWVNVGAVSIVTGGLDGVLTFVPDMIAGESCQTGALQFIVGGIVKLVQCLLFKDKQQTLRTTTDQNLETTTQLLTTTTRHTRTDNDYHTWTKTCG